MEKTEINIKTLENRINSLEFRERLLIVITIIAALLFAIDTLVLHEQLQDRGNLQKNINATETEIIASRSLQQQLLSELNEDPSARENLRLNRYTTEIRRLDQVLKDKTLEFISPQQMVDVLRSLIQQQSGLQLVGLESAKPNNPLQDDSESLETNKNTTLPNIYVHAVNMHFEGDYLSVLKYVARLESLQWRFSWDSLEIKMDDYPSMNVLIRLETLSMQEGWIGV